MKPLSILLFSFGIFTAALAPTTAFSQEGVKDAAQKLSDLCSLTKSDVSGLKYSETLFTTEPSPFVAHGSDGKALAVQPFEFQTLAAFDGTKGFLSIPGVVEGAGKSLSADGFQKLVSLMKQLERLHEVGGPNIERILRVQQKDSSIRVGFLITKPTGKIGASLFNPALKPSEKLNDATKLVDSLVALVDANWMPLNFNPSSVLLSEPAKDAKAATALGVVPGVSPWNLKLLRKSELPDLTPPKEGSQPKPGHDLASAKIVRAGLESSIATAQQLKAIMKSNVRLVRANACGGAIAAMQAAIDSMKIPEEKAKSSKGDDGDFQLGQVGMKRK